MEILNFEDGTKTQAAYVTIDGVNHTVTPAKYTGKIPLSALSIIFENVLKFFIY